MSLFKYDIYRSSYSKIRLLYELFYEIHVRDCLLNIMKVRSLGLSEVYSFINIRLFTDTRTMRNYLA